MRLIIHIGVHKTGTSALQAFLHRNRQELARQGVWYSPPAGHTNHTAIAQAFRTENSAGPEAILKNVADAEANGCTTCLISSEVFVEHPFHVDDLKKSIVHLDTTVIAYMRRPDEVVVSAHNELVRGEKSRWTTAISERKPYDPTYRSIFVHWLEGPWRLVIAPYDKNQWPEGSLLNDFARMIPLDPGTLDFSVSQEGANRSLPPALIEVLRVANRIDMDAAQREALIRGLFEVWDIHPDWYATGSLLSDEQREFYFEQLKIQLPRYRPYYRENFDEGFLLDHKESGI